MTATAAEMHGWLVKWSRPEVVEFMKWIEAAPVADLERHGRRIFSAARLGCFDAAIRRDLERRLEARRVQLGVAAPSGVV